MVGYGVMRAAGLGGAIVRRKSVEAVCRVRQVHQD